MKYVGKIPKIKRLADRFGTPLKSVEFVGNGVRFLYVVGGTVHDHYYSDADRGIEEEIERLERLLAIEI